MLFLISAIMTGSASISLVGCLERGFRGMTHDQISANNKLMIRSVDFTLMIFSIISVFLFIVSFYTSTRSSVDSAHLIMGGPFTLSFWVLVVGIGMILPFALEVYELIPHYIKQVELKDYNPWTSWIIAVSVLAGGFAMRYIVIYAGQMSQVIS